MRGFGYGKFLRLTDPHADAQGLEVWLFLRSSTLHHHRSSTSRSHIRTGKHAYSIETEAEATRREGGGAVVLRRAADRRWDVAGATSRQERGCPEKMPGTVSASPSSPHEAFLKLWLESREE